MNHYKIIVQYDGTRYKGWQVQGNTKDTIQGKIEEILSKIANNESGWEEQLPDGVAEMIKERGMFGYKEAIEIEEL